MDQRRILLVESEAEYAQQIKKALEKRGRVEVEVANDGPQGLQRARKSPPDLVILCVELPKMSGYSICNKLKKNPELKQIPLIIMSSVATPEIFEQHRKLKTRAEDYLIKPFEMNSLVSKVDQLVGLPPHGPSPALEVQELQPEPVVDLPIPDDLAAATDVSISMGTTFSVDDELIIEDDPEPGIDEVPELPADEVIEDLSESQESQPMDQAVEAAFDAIAQPSNLPPAIPGDSSFERDSIPVDIDLPEDGDTIHLIDDSSHPGGTSGGVSAISLPEVEAAPGAGDSEPLPISLPDADDDSVEVELPDADDAPAPGPAPEPDPELVSRLEALEAQNRQLSAELQATQARATELKQRLDQVPEAEAQDELTRERDLIEMREKMGAKEREILDLKVDLDGKEHQILDQKSKVRELERKVQEMDDKVLGVEKAAVAARGQLRDLKRENKRLKQAEGESGAELERLRAELEQARAEVTETKKAQQSLVEDQLQDKELELEQVRGELEQASQEAEQASSELEQARGELEQAYAELKQAKQQLEQQEQERQTQQQEAEQRHRQELEQAEQEQQQRLEQAQQEAGQASSELEQARGELQQAYAELQQAKQQLERREQELQRQLEETLEGAAAEGAEALETALAEATRQREQALADLGEEHQATLDELRQEGEQQQEEIKRQNAEQLADLNSRHSKQLTDLEQQSQELKQELEVAAEQLQEQAAQTQQQLEQTTSELQQVRSELRDLEGKLELARSALTDKEHQIQELELNSAGHQERILQAFNKIRTDQQLVDRAKRALAVALTVLEQQEQLPQQEGQEADEDQDQDQDQEPRAES